MKKLVTAAYLLMAASAYGALTPTPIVIAGATPVPANTPVPQNTPVPENTPVAASTPMPGAPSGTAEAFDPWLAARAQGLAIDKRELSKDLTPAQAARLRAQLRDLQRSHALRRRSQAAKMSPTQRKAFQAALAELAAEQKAVELP